MDWETPFCFGVESEFAVLGQQAAREAFLHGLPDRCRQRYPALPSRINARDIFLPWGRLYIDVGSHPEWAAAETSDPWMAVYLQKVGERILSQMAGEFSEDIVVSRHNVDCLSKTSWGNHESYLFQACSQQQLADILIPHLVTRVIYTGAGGLTVDLDRKTCRFSLSPRTDYLTRLISTSSQLDRPLFHLKNEPLCSRYNRLHLICGENLYSEKAAFLKLAATALLVILADHEPMPVCHHLLSDPLQSMRLVASDMHLKKSLTSKTGKMTRALDTQWQYLDFVYSRLDKPYMPPWGRFTCDLWRQTLQQLEKGWLMAADRLDWTVKLDLFERQLNQWGYSLLQTGKPPILTEKQLMTLLEYDLCCCRLGRHGLFSRLDKKGRFQHRVPGIPNTESEPFQMPVLVRAAVRAGAIQRLAAEDAKRYAADWMEILDRQENKRLDLQDIACMQEKWTGQGNPILDQLTAALGGI